MRRAAPRSPRSSNLQGRDEERARKDALLDELGHVYRDADASYQGWSCPASTECCRFGITGREPYVTSIELAAVRRSVAALGGPKAWKRATRSLPLVGQDDRERPCPLLTAEGRCAIYAHRPLGCRTFYCDRASKGDGAAVRHKEVTALVRRVQAIAARHEPGGDQGRPLTRALTELAGGPSRRR